MRFGNMFIEALRSGALVDTSTQVWQRIAGPNQSWFLPTGKTHDKASDLCFKPALANGRGVFQVTDKRVFVQLGDKSGGFENAGRAFSAYVAANHIDLQPYVDMWDLNDWTKRWGFKFDDSVDRLTFLRAARILLEFIEKNSNESKSGF